MLTRGKLFLGAYAALLELSNPLCIPYVLKNSDLLEWFLTGEFSEHVKAADNR